MPALFIHRRAELIEFMKVIMTSLIDLSAEEAKTYLLKAKSYFRQDFPPYISLQPVLDEVAAVLGNATFRDFQKGDVKPETLDGVNYRLIASKDGRLAWRPFELIHPAIYVSLVNVICDEGNWKTISDRFKELHAGKVDCCGFPVIAVDEDGDDAAQIKHWWLEYEQRTLDLSLDYTHVLQTDVTDCYGSIYTHSIAWALHGIPNAKKSKGKKSLLGNKIDNHIQSGRYGQTNGITQGSVLMDLIAELVLAFVDQMVSEKIEEASDVKILRYRDDYRVFAQSDHEAEKLLKIISDCLQAVGMKLGAPKTSLSTNVVEAAIKPEKLAAIQLADMDISQAKSFQKQLLRLHSFARKYPNSGALNRLASEAYDKVWKGKEVPDDLHVHVAIVADIAAISPQAFPALSGILAKLISMSQPTSKECLWQRVSTKMKRIPYNGYLEVWLQRVTQAKGVELKTNSHEAICKIVNGEIVPLWNNSWIQNDSLLAALEVSKIVVGKPEDQPEVPDPSELILFKKYAEFS